MTVAADGPSSLPVLYLMAPMTLYGSPVLTVAREYPFAALTGCEVELVCAEDLFCCNRCWIAAWPELRARIKYGVFLDHLGGFAGRGTFAEVMELLALSVPVWWYRGGEPTDSFRFGEANYRDWGGRYRAVLPVPQDAPARR